MNRYEWTAIGIMIWSASEANYLMLIKANLALVAICMILFFIAFCFGYVCRSDKD